MDLRINQQYGRIGLNIKEPNIKLDIVKPQMDLNITEPKLRIDSEQPQIQIDQDACFADMNLRKPVDFSRYIYQKSKNVVLEAIGRIAQEGDYLAGIEYGNKPSSLARSNNHKTVEYNIGLVPEHKPSINFIIKPVQIEVQPGDVKTNSNIGDVKINLDRGNVKVYMLQKPDIQIDYVGKQLDKTA